MIDPANITKFDRTQAELEEFLLFCIVAAGKNAKVQAKKLEQFLFNVDELRPFDWLRVLYVLGELRKQLEECKLGQYTRLEKCFGEVAFNTCATGHGCRRIRSNHLELLQCKNTY